MVEGVGRHLCDWRMECDREPDEVEPVARAELRQDAASLGADRLDGHAARRGDLGRTWPAAGFVDTEIRSCPRNREQASAALGRDCASSSAATSASMSSAAQTIATLIALKIPVFVGQAFVPVATRLSSRLRPHPHLHPKAGVGALRSRPQTVATGASPFLQHCPMGGGGR